MRGIQAFWAIALSIGILAACAGLPQPDLGSSSQGGSMDNTPIPPGQPAPWQPMAGDDKLARSEVSLEGQDLLTLESYPPQYMLKLSGALPTPCHQLRVKVNPPNQQNQINVEVYALAKPDELCIQMLEPFEVTVPLGTQPSGTYTVVVNGKQVGEVTY